ncbi:MAG TPA: hypothetical protein VLV83_24885, partial [Acidobacteriota bacterium]|nr:hypothetical protein [Acidobacteriota bacterium]
AMVATRQAVLNRSRAPEERWSKERLVEYLEETREQMREDLANGCWMPQLYVYRQATDAELTQYLEFFESETGRWYLNLGRKASQDAWAAAGLRLGDAGFEYPWEEVKELSKK